MCNRGVRFVFFFKQKTAYEMRISDWSLDVCSSDLTDRTDCGNGDDHAALEPDRTRRPAPDRQRFRIELGRSGSGRGPAHINIAHDGLRRLLVSPVRLIRTTS